MLAWSGGSLASACRFPPASGLASPDTRQTSRRQRGAGKWARGTKNEVLPLAGCPFLDVGWRCELFQAVTLLPSQHFDALIIDGGECKTNIDCIVLAAPNLSAWKSKKTSHGNQRWTLLRRALDDLFPSPITARSRHPSPLNLSETPILHTEHNKQQ